MSESASGQFRTLLIEARQGNKEAEAQWIQLVYWDLRRLAQHYLKSERPNHTLQATELVHEVYLRLFGENQVDWQERSHFLIVAARQMRRILIDHSRSAAAAKRNGNGQRISLEDAAGLALLDNDAGLISLNEALEDLEKLRPRACGVVDLRFFVGFTEEEAARVLNVSVTTVKREWNFAKAWLYSEIRAQEKTGSRAEH